jgi:hypothetical protein
MVVASMLTVPLQSPIMDLRWLGRSIRRTGWNLPAVDLGSDDVNTSESGETSMSSHFPGRPPEIS